MRTCGWTLLFALLSVGVAQAERFHCATANSESAYPAGVQLEHDHIRFAPRPFELVQEFEAFVASFDGPDDDDGDGHADLRATPQWVAYELIGLTPNARGAYVEPDISIDRDWYRSAEFAFIYDAVDRTRRLEIDDSYTGVGTIWNRGHLAMADHAQRISAIASCNTNTYWNAVPQAADLNQGPWLHLENYTAALANAYGRVWIIAGPIYDRDQQVLTIGDTGEVPVAVPHALFKVVVLEIDGVVFTLTFIFDQPYTADAAGIPQPLANTSWIRCSRARAAQHIYDHRPNLSSVAEIERRTGLTFFAGRADRAALVNTTPTALWPVDPMFWSGQVCGQNSVPG